MNEPLKYRIALMRPDGKIVGKTQLLTIWNTKEAIKYRGRLIGEELAKAAIADAGKND